MLLKGTIRVQLRNARMLPVAAFICQRSAMVRLSAASA